MPLGRYFVFAGSVLLALLLFAEWYLPQLAATPARAEVDRSVIRLHSQHRWPERIVIDTTLPTIVPPAQIAEAPPVKATPATRSPREAFALAMPAQAATPAIAPKPAPKRRTRTVRAARTAQTGGHVASYEAFGFRPMSPNW